MCLTFHLYTPLLPPEPILTVKNVIEVMENVSLKKRKEVLSEAGIILDPQLEEIYRKYSTEEQRIHACADIYVNCRPHSSWTYLCHGLCNKNEVTAARKAKTFIPQTGERIIAEVYLYIVTVQDNDNNNKPHAHVIK